MDERDLIKEACDDYVGYLRSDDFHEDGMDDYKHEIFEKAMERYYGPGIWAEINEKLS